nr:hypothetical protein BCU57_19230 [Shewanella sp. 10N.286.48.B5]
MNQHIVIPTRSLGFEYDLELHNWHHKLKAFRVFEDKPKEPLDGGLGLSLNLISQCSSDREWQKSIPEQYLTKSAVFPEHQFQMLWLAANAEQAAQLLQTRFLLLVLICEEYPVDNNVALEICKLGQREILDRLGYDNGKGALKFIDKLSLDFERDIELQHVKKQLDVRFSRYKVFKHYPSVNLNALSIDQKYPFLTSTRLGKIIANEDKIKKGSLLAYLADTFTLGVNLGVNDPAKRIGELHSIDALVQLHQLWVDRQNDIRILKKRPEDADISYPKMIAGNEHIVAVNNYDELFEEGVKQKHCIAIYHRRIVLGEYCVFSMLTPQRVTIGIKILSKKPIIIQLDQIAGLRNALPENKTREIVYKWLEQEKQNINNIN